MKIQKLVNKVTFIVMPLIIVGLLLSGLTIVKVKADDISKHTLTLLPDICSKKPVSFGYSLDLFIPMMVILIFFIISTLTLLNREPFRKLILPQEHFRPPCH
jgi:hypothetical protein